jgi:two-component system chemotaxis response regulator CheY
MKILVVDDMKTMRKILIRNLQELGFSSIVEAEDGQKAWEALEREAKSKDPVRLVLSDWNMPHLSGIDLLRKARKDSRFSSLQFVLITAEAENNSKQEANQPDARADAFLEKPFRAEDLKGLLKQIGAASKKAA